MLLKPITSEKAVKLIDIENTLIFEAPRDASKGEIKKEFESLFSVKVEKVRTLVRQNRKIAFIRIIKSTPASDIASKLGII